MAAIDHWIWIIICPIIAYFIGSIPFSYIIAKWRTGEDLRKTGLGNVGGLNVMVKSGFNWGLLAGGLDFYKGLATIIAVLAIPFDNTPLACAGKYWEITKHNLIYIFVAMAVILGHNYPIFLKFQGGRGIAVTVSFLVLTNPLLLLIFIFSMVVFLALTRYVRPSQFLAIFIGTPIAFFLRFSPPWMVLTHMSNPFITGLFVIGISLAIFPKYLMAFIGMFKGTEYQIGKKGGIIIKDTNKESTKNGSI